MLDFDPRFAVPTFAAAVRYGDRCRTALSGRDCLRGQCCDGVLQEAREFVLVLDCAFVRHGPGSDASAVGRIFCELGALKFLQAPIQAREFLVGSLWL